MTLALITLHRIVNYGSVLQTYATQRILETLGTQVKVIDYYDERMTMHGMLKRLKNKKKALQNPLFLLIAELIMFPSYVTRFRIFKKFLREQIHLTEKTYHSFEELQSYIPEADIYCTGSDQVWNSGWNEKIDKALFLEFVAKGKPCFAYAASFGKQKLDDWEIPETQNLLKKYLALSCRESAGVKILKNLGFESQYVLDPTLLLNGENWKELASKKFENKKYVFVYNLNRNKKIDETAKFLSKRFRIPIYTVSYCYHEIPLRQGKVFVNPPVEDFLSLLANASYVITDSFHATAFSINFGREFFVFYPGLFSSRLSSVLELVGAKDRALSEPKDIEKFLNRTLDYSGIHNALQKARNESMDFLKMALEKSNEVAYRN